MWFVKNVIIIFIMGVIIEGIIDKLLVLLGVGDGEVVCVLVIVIKLDVIVKMIIMDFKMFVEVIVWIGDKKLFNCK